jgi:amino acid transporter
MERGVAQSTGSGARGKLGYDVADRGDLDKLHTKAVGLIGVLFLTVTGAAPISAMLFNVPIAVGYGNGIGAPAAFLVATVILLIFSVGYAAMAAKVTAVGGFYSFISHGLGREVGMGFGFGSVVAYSVFEASLAGGFAYFANLDLKQWIGIDVPWPILSLIMIAGISFLTYFDVKVSTAILGVALIAEVAILAIFAIGVFTSSGAHVDIAAVNPFNAFRGFPGHDKIAAGAAGIGLFFAFWSWVGFEMAPNYAEESRDPKRIVPLSLYVSVLALGIFYTIVSWAAVSGYPKIEDAIAQAQANSADFFFASARLLIGNWVAVLMSILILSGSFACGMAFHNTAARYLYSLGRERVLPGSLGKTHPVHRTPHVASFTQSVIAAVIILIFAIKEGVNDPTTQAYLEVYGLMALVGTILIVAAQAVVSLAIIMYFRTHHPDDHHWWKTLIAPLIALVTQAYVVYLCVVNMDFLGGGLRFANYIIWIDAAVLVIGILGAIYIKASDPEKYDKIGRLIYEGLPEGK